MKTGTSIYINRKFECPVNELFKWITSPELITKWFGPKRFTVSDMVADLRIGGSYEIKLLTATGEMVRIAGNYLEIIRPIRLSFTFNYVGIQNPPPKSIVKIRLESMEEKSTMLFLEQTFETAPIDFERRAEAWEYMFSKLAQLFD